MFRELRERSRKTFYNWYVESHIVGAAAAVFAVQQLSILPPHSPTLIGLLVSALGAFALFLRETPPRRILTLFFVFALAASYAALRADLRMGDELAREHEGRDIEIVGVIDEMPQRNERSVRFAFRVEAVLTPSVHVPQRISLGWYQPPVRELVRDPLPELHAGERWRWTVRLKRPHGNANPAGFDAEAWMLERNLRASGSIQVDEFSKRLDANAGRLSDHLERLRESIRDRMRQALAEKPYAGVLIALAIGDQAAISNADWSLFNATAVSHLLSISGAHVTLFAAWIAFVTFAMWRRSPLLCARLPAHKAAAVVAAVVALLYAALTGFAVPAQRTCYMLVVAALSLLLSRSLSPWLVLSWSALAVLVIDPWAVLAVGFWFSFAAVAMLMYVTQNRIGRETAMRVAVKTQIAVTLGLVPLSLAFFQQVSLVGPIANAIAIPLISFLVIPLTLLWLVLPIDALLSVAHVLIDGLASLLKWLVSFNGAMWSQHSPPWWAVALAIAGVVWLLAPRLVKYRWVGALWCLPLFTVTPPTPEPGEFSVTALDIGQGTAVVVRTASKTMVYDTGPRWADDTDAGLRLIVPYLRASGSARVDGLVVSHLDLDHSGGAKSILANTPTTWLLTSMFAEADIIADARRRNIATYACQAGQRWTWDGVEFEVLHPDATSYLNAKLKTNDRSCVIKVKSARGQSALLTGDIERTSELTLVDRSSVALRADVLLVPHHGSLTSSVDEFIDAVSPRVALINAGYRNRFGHPREEVLSRYEARNIALLRTDWHGAITISSNDQFRHVRQERNERRRYWVDRVDPADKRPIE